MFLNVLNYESLQLKRVLLKQVSKVLFEVQVLKAGSGDSILITYADEIGVPRNILIDGGTGQIYQKSLKAIMEKLEQLDLIIVTHIDLDHIGGINKLLGSEHRSKIQKVYFNSASLLRKNDSTLVSISDGVKLTDYLSMHGIEIHHEPIYTGSETVEHGLSIRFLSPTIEALAYLEKQWTEFEVENTLISATTLYDDRCLSDIAQDPFEEKRLLQDIANWSSLAFEIIYKDVRILFLGDAKDSVIVESLKANGFGKHNQYKVDYIKLSHHGSKYNTSHEFLEIIDCNNFIFSTNGTHDHPHIETMARILCHPKRDRLRQINLYFNYSKDEYLSKQIRLLTEEEEKSFNCKAIYDHTVFNLGEVISA